MFLIFVQLWWKNLGQLERFEQIVMQPVMQVSQPDKTFAAKNQTNNNKQKY